MLDKPLRQRALAGLAKGVAEGAMGAGVLWLVAARVASGVPPEPVTMGVIGTLALAANLGCALLLMRCRQGDSNLRSAWLASRNDAFANIAVLAAAGGVVATTSVWPDVAAGTGSGGQPDGGLWDRQTGPEGVEIGIGLESIWIILTPSDGMWRVAPPGAPCGAMWDIGQAAQRSRTAATCHPYGAVAFGLGGRRPY